MALGAGYNRTMLRPPFEEEELTSTAICSEVMAYPMRRSKVTRRPSVPPGPSRPFTSALVIALSCQPWEA